MRKKEDFPSDLTEEQIKALNGYFNDPKRLLFGVSPERAIENFREINALKKEDLSHASIREARWFDILHYTKQSDQPNP